KVHYSDPEIVLANTNLRLWRTTNLATWNNISGSAPTNNMSSFAIDPYDSNKIWITYSSYSEGKQVYRTIDGGTTWENMSLNLPALPVNCITIEKSSTGGVYIGTDVGVYYIDESLDLWEQYMTGLPNVIVNELEIQDDHSQLVAATYGRGIWRSATRNVINVGIETQSSSKSELLISPNPTNGEFKITCSDEIQNIQLLDAYGKLLQEYKPKSNFVVATSNNLASGIYYLHATGLNGPILERLIISE
ncbi:MAG: ligand-binding sensor domain-containing protein, partial [Bacteroidia bacterium]